VGGGTTQRVFRPPHCIPQPQKLRFSFRQQTFPKLTRKTNHDCEYFGDIRIIPLNSEKYLQFEIGELCFMDSCQFLSSSLDELVSLLAKAGKENFFHILKHLGTDDDLVFSRRVYPYSHMKSRKQLKETELPPISKFHDSLRNEPLDPQDYERAKATWSKFDIQNLQRPLSFD